MINIKLYLDALIFTSFATNFLIFRYIFPKNDKKNLFFASLLIAILEALVNTSKILISCATLLISLAFTKNAKRSLLFVIVSEVYSSIFVFLAAILVKNNAITVQKANISISVEKTLFALFISLCVYLSSLTLENFQSADTDLLLCISHNGKSALARARKTKNCICRIENTDVFCKNVAIISKDLARKLEINAKDGLKKGAFLLPVTKNKEKELLLAYFAKACFLRGDEKIKEIRLCIALCEDENFQNYDAILPIIC